MEFCSIKPYTHKQASTHTNTHYYHQRAVWPVSRCTDSVCAGLKKGNSAMKRQVEKRSLSQYPGIWTQAVVT